MSGWGRRVAVGLGLLVAGFAAAGEVRGWRNDGTNVYPSGLVSALATEGRTLWKAGMTWGNSSPVVIGSRICTSAEPTTILCVDAASGRLLWQAKNDVVDALPVAAQAPIRAQIDAAVAAEVKLGETKRAYSALQREVRRAPDDTALAAKLTTTATELDRLKTIVDGAAVYRTPADKEIIGYASATPVTDGTNLYVLYGNGVVSSYTVDGKRRWSRWLGPHIGDMRGYHMGSSASPLLVDGKLIVGFVKLQALDPATGNTVWNAGDYRDFGTPGVARVGGVAVLLTPDGRMVRVSDGKTLQTGLGNIWYVGPLVDGSTVYYLGSTSDGHAVRRDAKAVVTALSLASDGAGGVRATPRYTAELTTQQTFYAQPVLHMGLIYAPTHRGELHVVDASNGATVYRQDLSGQVFGEIYASPVIAGDSVVMVGWTGITVVGRTGRSWTQKAQGQVPTTRATPVVVGDRTYLRAYEGLYCLRTGG